MNNPRITNVNGSLQFKSPYLAYQRSNKLTYDTIKYRRAQAEYLKQKNYDPYKDPDRFKSLADVLFNKHAQENYNEQNGSGNLADYFAQYWKDNYIKPTKGTSRLINSVNSIFTDLDFGTNIVRTGLQGKDIWKDAFGQGDRGVVMNPWNTGNGVANFALDIVTDPVNIASIVAGALAAGPVGAAAGASFKSALTTSLKEVGEKAVKEAGEVAVNKAVKSINKQAMKILRKEGLTDKGKDSLVRLLNNAKITTYKQPTELVKDLASMNSFRIADNVRKLRKGINAVDTGILKASVMATPGGAGLIAGKIGTTAYKKLKQLKLETGTKYALKAVIENLEDLAKNKFATDEAINKLFRDNPNSFVSYDEAFKDVPESLQYEWYTTVQNKVMKNNPEATAYDIQEAYLKHAAERVHVLNRITEGTVPTDRLVKYYEDNLRDDLPGLQREIFGENIPADADNQLYEMYLRARKDKFKTPKDAFAQKIGEEYGRIPFFKNKEAFQKLVDTFEMKAMPMDKTNIFTLMNRFYPSDEHIGMDDIIAMMQDSVKFMPPDSAKLSTKYRLLKRMGLYELDPTRDFILETLLDSAQKQINTDTLGLLDELNALRPAAARFNNTADVYKEYEKMADKMLANTGGLDLDTLTKRFKQVMKEQSGTIYEFEAKEEFDFLLYSFQDTYVKSYKYDFTTRYLSSKYPRTMKTLGALNVDLRAVLKEYSDAAEQFTKYYVMNNEIPPFHEFKKSFLNNINKHIRDALKGNPGAKGAHYLDLYQQVVQFPDEIYEGLRKVMTDPNYIVALNKKTLHAKDVLALLRSQNIDADPYKGIIDKLFGDLYIKKQNTIPSLAKLMIDLDEFADVAADMQHITDDKIDRRYWANRQSAANLLDAFNMAKDVEYLATENRVKDFKKLLNNIPEEVVSDSVKTISRLDILTRALEKLTTKQANTFASILVTIDPAYKKPLLKFLSTHGIGKPDIELLDRFMYMFNEGTISVRQVPSSLNKLKFLFDDFRKVDLPSKMPAPKDPASDIIEQYWKDSYYKPKQHVGGFETTSVKDKPNRVQLESSFENHLNKIYNRGMYHESANKSKPKTIAGDLVKDIEARNKAIDELENPLTDAELLEIEEHLDGVSKILSQNVLSNEEYTLLEDSLAQLRVIMDKIQNEKTNTNIGIEVGIKGFFKAAQLSELREVVDAMTEISEQQVYLVETIEQLDNAFKRFDAALDSLGSSEKIKYIDSKKADATVSNLKALGRHIEDLNSIVKTKVEAVQTFKYRKPRAGMKVSDSFNWNNPGYVWMMSHRDATYRLVQNLLESSERGDFIKELLQEDSRLAETMSTVIRLANNEGFYELSGRLKKAINGLRSADNYKTLVLNLNSLIDKGKQKSFLKKDIEQIIVNATLDRVQYAGYESIGFYKAADLLTPEGTRKMEDVFARIKKDVTDYVRKTSGLISQEAVDNLDEKEVYQLVYDILKINGIDLEDKLSSARHMLEEYIEEQAKHNMNVLQIYGTYDIKEIKGLQDNYAELLTVINSKDMMIEVEAKIAKLKNSAYNIVKNSHGKNKTVDEFFSDPANYTSIKNVAFQKYISRLRAYTDSRSAFNTHIEEEVVRFLNAFTGFNKTDINAAKITIMNRISSNMDMTKTKTALRADDLTRQTEAVLPADRMIYESATSTNIMQTHIYGMKEIKYINRELGKEMVQFGKIYNHAGEPITIYDMMLLGGHINDRPSQYATAVKKIHNPKKVYPINTQFDDYKSFVTVDSFKKHYDKAGYYFRHTTVGTAWALKMYATLRAMHSKMITPVKVKKGIAKAPGNKVLRSTLYVSAKLDIDFDDLTKLFDTDINEFKRQVYMLHYAYKRMYKDSEYFTIAKSIEQQFKSGGFKTVDVRRLVKKAKEKVPVIASVQQTLSLSKRAKEYYANILKRRQGDEHALNEFKKEMNLKRAVMKNRGIKGTKNMSYETIFVTDYLLARDPEQADDYFKMIKKLKLKGTVEEGRKIYDNWMAADTPISEYSILNKRLALDRYGVKNAAVMTEREIFAHDYAYHRFDDYRKIYNKAKEMYEDADTPHGILKQGQVDYYKKYYQFKNETPIEHTIKSQIKIDKINKLFEKGMKAALPSEWALKRYRVLLELLRDTHGFKLTRNVEDLTDQEVYAIYRMYISNNADYVKQLNEDFKAFVEKYRGRLDEEYRGNIFTPYYEKYVMPDLPSREYNLPLNPENYNVSAIREYYERILEYYEDMIQKRFVSEDQIIFRRMNLDAALADPSIDKSLITLNNARELTDAEVLSFNRVMFIVYGDDYNLVMKHMAEGDMIKFMDQYKVSAGEYLNRKKYGSTLLTKIYRSKIKQLFREYLDNDSVMAALKAVFRNDDIFSRLINKLDNVDDLVELYKLNNKYYVNNLKRLNQTPHEYVFNHLINELDDRDVLAFYQLTQEHEVLRGVVKDLFGDPEEKLDEIRFLSLRKTIDELRHVREPDATEESIDRVFRSILKEDLPDDMLNQVFREIEKNWSESLNNLEDLTGIRSAVVESVSSNLNALRYLESALNNLRSYGNDALKNYYKYSFINKAEAVLSMTAKQQADFIRAWTPGYLIFDNRDKVFENILFNTDELAAEGITLIKKEDLYLLVNTRQADFNKQSFNLVFHDNRIHASGVQISEDIKRMNEILFPHADMDNVPFGKGTFVPEIFRHTEHEMILKDFAEDFNSVNAILNEEFFTKRGINFNNTVFGSINRVADVLNVPSSNLVTALMTNWFEILKRTNSSIKFVRLFDDVNFRLDNPIYGNLFQNMSDKQLTKWFKQERFKVVLIQTRQKGGAVLPRIDTYPITGHASMQKAIEMGAILVPNETYSMMYRSVNKYKIDVKVLDWFNRTVMATFKTSYLFTLGFLFRNLIDTNLKNAIVIKDMSEIPELIKNTYQAGKMLLFHEKIQSETIRLFGNINEKNLIYVLKQYPHAMRNAYFFTEMFRKSMASSGLSNSVKEMLKNFYIDESDDAMEQFIRFYDDKLLGNPIMSKMQQTQDMIEQTARMGLVLHEFKSTGDFGRAINLAIDTHFDYSTKTPLEMYGELVIPFLTFPLRNMAFYAEHYLDNPRLIATLADLYETNWDSEDRYKSLTTPGKYLRGQVEQGNLRFGDYILKTNTSIFDVMNLIHKPVDSLTQRVSPYLRSAINAGDTEYDHVTNLIPFKYNTMRAMQSASDIVSGKGNASSFAPSILSKLKEYTPKTYTRGALRWGTPRTYRRKTYIYRKNPASVFRSIYGKAYTKKGFSKIKLATLTGKSGYYADPKKIVYAVNKIKWMFR